MHEYIVYNVVLGPCPVLLSVREAPPPLVCPCNIKLARCKSMQVGYIWELSSLAFWDNTL